MKRVLIFGGGTGVIAEQVANALAATAWATPVFADVVRPASLHVAVEHVPTNITDSIAMAKVLDGVDAIVSCVESNPELVGGSAAALFGAIRERNDVRVVLLSSMAVYGGATGVVNERAPVVQDNPYSTARVKAEILAAAHPDAVCLRSGVEYGPGSERWSRMIARLLLSRRLGDLGAAGDGYCNLLFMDDLVNAIVGAVQLQTTQQRVFNLCSNERLTWNEYFVRYALALRAVPVRRIGSRRLKIEKKLAIPLKLAELGLGSSMANRLHLPAPITSSMMSVFNQRIGLDVTNAERVLGMQWTPITTGLQSAAQWVRSTL
jgi:nucleoside-diphosphate-sugar epimerase